MLYKWLKRERIRMRARSEIKDVRKRAPPTRQGQRAMAQQIGKIRTKMNKEIAQTCARNR